MSVTWEGDSVVEDVRRRAMGGVAEGANLVLLAAQPKTPMREGLLRASLFALIPTVEGREIVSGVGTNLVYAAYQHELPASANFTTAGTGPKYLENAMDEQREAVKQIITNYLKGGF